MPMMMMKADQTTLLPILRVRLVAASHQLAVLVGDVDSRIASCRKSETEAGTSRKFLHAFGSKIFKNYVACCAILNHRFFKFCPVLGIVHLKSGSAMLQLIESTVSVLL